MKKRAFTLVELMAASAIMSIIVLGVLSVATSILKTYNRASGQLQNYFDANIVGNIIVEDLESVLLKKDGRAWLQVSYPLDVGELKGTSYTGNQPLRPPQIMFYAPTSLRPLFTKENTTFEIGDNSARVNTMIPGSLCAIKYQLALKSPFMESTGNEADEMQYNATYSLYRAVIDSRSTVIDNMGSTKQGYTSNPDSESYRYALENNVWNGTSSVVDEKGEEVSGVRLSTWAVAPENLLATNVVDFRVTFAVMYENISAVSADDPKYKIGYIPPGVPFTVGPKILATEAYEISQGGGRMNVDVGSEEFKSGSLAFADVSVTFVSAAGAQEIQALQRSGRMNMEEFQRIVSQNSITIVRRIKFMTQPLY